MPLVESLILSQNVELTNYESTKDNVAQELSRIDWKVEQGQDPDIARVISLLSTGERPTTQQTELESFHVKKYLCDWNHYVLEHGVL